MVAIPVSLMGLHSQSYRTNELPCVMEGVRVGRVGLRGTRRGAFMNENAPLNRPEIEAIMLKSTKEAAAAVRRNVAPEVSGASFLLCRSSRMLCGFGIIRMSRAPVHRKERRSKWDRRTGGKHLLQNKHIFVPLRAALLGRYEEMTL